MRLEERIRKADEKEMAKLFWFCSIKEKDNFTLLRVEKNKWITSRQESGKLPSH